MSPISTETLWRVTQMLLLRWHFHNFDILLLASCLPGSASVAFWSSTGLLWMSWTTPQQLFCDPRVAVKVTLVLHGYLRQRKAQDISHWSFLQEFGFSLPSLRGCYKQRTSCLKDDLPAELTLLLDRLLDLTNFVTKWGKMSQTVGNVMEEDDFILWHFVESEHQ